MTTWEKSRKLPGDFDIGLDSMELRLFVLSRSSLKGYHIAKTPPEVHESAPPPVTVPLPKVFYHVLHTVSAMTATRIKGKRNVLSSFFDKRSSVLDRLLWVQS